MSANRVVPGLLDRYLARTGYDSQQTSQPAIPASQTTCGSRATGPGHRPRGARRVRPQSTPTELMKAAPPRNMRAMGKHQASHAGEALATLGVINTGVAYRLFIC